MVRAAFPIQIIFSTAWNTFIAYNLILITASFTNLQLSEYFLIPKTIIQTIGIVYLIPNMLQRVCLHFITSNMHYFGDIKRGKEGLVQQCQILNPWYFIPLQIFCFNFGATHGIHHFVANQPFYIRQLISKTCQAAMVKYGVRHNDVANIFRANRYALDALPQYVSRAQQPIENITL